MTRSEYMEKLKAETKIFDDAYVSEIISDYEEYFDNGEKDGRTDAQIIKELGPIDDFIKELDREAPKKESEMLRRELEMERKHIAIKIQNVTAELHTLHNMYESLSEKLASLS